MRRVPLHRVSRDTLYQLASVLWVPAEAEKVRGVSSWVDLLDMDVKEIGPSGIGPMIHFMEPGLAVACLPAWLIMSDELAFPAAGVLSGIVVLLDKDADRYADEPERFADIEALLDADQRSVIATVFREIAEVQFRDKPELMDYLVKVSDYWCLSAGRA